jgi:hypothetical protein
MQRCSPRQPSDDHHQQTQHEHDEADLVHAMHHAQTDVRIGITVKQVRRIQVVKHFFEKHSEGYS